jgi:Xaa-Pro dipeptidase
MSSAEETCMKMRMKKTPEELALTRRAYNYFNQMHASARDMLLQHGTDLTDYDIASAATKYGADLVMANIKRDGAPHTAVGIDIEVGRRIRKIYSFSASQSVSTRQSGEWSSLAN